MKITKTLMALAIALTIGFVSCKPKDADVKANVETALRANPDASGVSVSVDKGVATISGEVKDEATKAAVESATKGAKGVSSVVNNTSVAVAPVTFTPPVIAADDPLSAAVKDATKDHPTVTATVADGVVTLTGSIAKSKLMALMQTLNSLHPKKIENKLTVN